MPRPRRAFGRPGTAVIPTRWAADHRPVAEGTMTAPCTIRVPGTTQVWSPELEQNVETPIDPYFTGMCRVQALTNDARDVDAADDAVTVSGYLVTVPAHVAAQVDHLVVATDTGDTTLDGRALRVRDVVRGTHRFERDLYCSLGT